jgi:hypothetical protein
MPTGKDTMVGSSIVNMSYPVIALYKFTHDFTIYIFGPDIDQRLDHFFPRMDGDCDNLTPDLVF